MSTEVLIVETYFLIRPRSRRTRHAGVTSAANEASSFKPVERVLLLDFPERLEAFSRSHSYGGDLLTAAFEDVASNGWEQVAHKRILVR